jgi:hypothetical protein
LPARQALGHEAEEFGVTAPPEVGQRHGLKQSKSVKKPSAGQGNRQSQSGIGRWHPSFVEAAIIHDLKAFSTPAEEGIRALKLVPADLAPG